MIGIIGGNGVAATNRLCQIIEEKLTKSGAFRDAHHPEMLIWQATQVPSRSLFLEGRGESFVPGYIEIGKRMKNCGCSMLGMCCNTAYYAIDELQEEIGLPFINLLEEVAREVNNRGVKRIGMLCSDGLRKIRLYDKYFGTINHELHLIYPNDDMQKFVTQGICNAKNSKRNNPDCEGYPAKLFSLVCDWFSKQNVECIVGGCTDISAVFCPKEWGNIYYVDSLNVLADKVIFYHTKRN